MDQGADPEDPDEYRAQNIFWVPLEARWSYLKAQARQSTIGQLVDDAMAGIERDNQALKDVLPKDYARPRWTGKGVNTAGLRQKTFPTCLHPCFWTQSGRSRMPVWTR